MSTGTTIRRWPAEWEEHDATWLVWPHKEDTWPGLLDRIPAVYVQMVAALAPSERVEIVAQSDAASREIEARLARAAVPRDGYRIRVLATDDSWIRDHGPIFVEGQGGDAVALDWGYNAWGGKYPPWDLDDDVPRRLAGELGIVRVCPDMILEGGSVDGDGAGTILTTESCLLHPNRNPALDRAEIERRLTEFLGARKILWLGDGIVGDDTDGHVDDITRFVARGRVVTAVEDDPDDANYAPLQRNLARLESMTDADGRSLDVVPLPMPRAVHHEGERLPASYANFYIGNGAVLVPVFDDPADERALEILGTEFPGRRVVGIPARDLVWGLGACHCLTQQQPASR